MFKGSGSSLAIQTLARPLSAISYYYNTEHACAAMLNSAKVASCTPSSRSGPPDDTVRPKGMLIECAAGEHHLPMIQSGDHKHY